MQKICKQCSAEFKVTQEDLVFYDKVSPVFNGQKYPIPEPSLCPDCRQQRRLAFRNERKLYHRKCDLTGKQIIAMYSEDKPYKVYDQSEWWSDKWDVMHYGKDFNFSRSFFQQFNELQKEVPRIALTNSNSENSEYTNYAANNKDCYLIFSNSYGHNENCYYATCLSKSHFCSDNIFLEACNYCYDNVSCKRCYKLVSSKDCIDCKDSYFLSNCRSCSNCIACKGLRNKQYCIQNKQYSKEAYEEIIEKSKLSTSSGLQKIREVFSQIDLTTPSIFARTNNCENSTGDYLENNKNCKQCFDTYDTEDGAFLQYSIGKVFRCYDTSYTVDSRDSYENMSLVSCNHGLFNNVTWFGNSDLLYSDLMFYSNNCFGCTGLRHKQYCILNKQYTKEEYEELVSKIIEHMKTTGEWGEFFPVSISPFGYNETIAQEYFPLTREAVLSQNWKWHEEEETQQNYLGPEVVVPDNISNVDESICQQILKCEVTGKPYKIIPQELAFYKEMNLPIPKRSPDQRHKDRMVLRNPRKLWTRNCDKCEKEIETTYAPERPEKVYCEECYLKEVY